MSFTHTLKENMYNVAYTCIYNKMADAEASNEQFQKDVLGALQTDEESLVSAVEELFAQVDCGDIMNSLKQLREVAVMCDTDVMVFMMLFSYDYFHQTHLFLCEYLETKTFGPHYDALRVLVESTVNKK